MPRYFVPGMYPGRNCPCADSHVRLTDLTPIRARTRYSPVTVNGFLFFNTLPSIITCVPFSCSSEVKEIRFSLTMSVFPSNSDPSLLITFTVTSLVLRLWLMVLATFGLKLILSAVYVTVLYSCFIR